MVQRASGGSAYGRCRKPGPGRGDRHGGGDDQAGTATAVYRRRVRDRGALGDSASGKLQAAQEANLQDGANPSSLRVAGLVGIEGDCEVLDRVAGVRTVRVDDIEVTVKASPPRRHRVTVE